MTTRKGYNLGNIVAVILLVLGINGCLFSPCPTEKAIVVYEDAKGNLRISENACAFCEVNQKEHYWECVVTRPKDVANLHFVGFETQGGTEIIASPVLKKK